MANIRKIEGKNGISFAITVTQGRDKSGKQMRHFKTWKPAQGMTERQAEKEVQKFALELEEQIKQGFAPNSKLTFSQYAQIVLDRKRKSGIKIRSIEVYEQALERINLAIGNLKLTDIHPATLNKFYDNLAEENIRKAVVKAMPKKDIRAILKSRKITITEISKASGIVPSTISNLIRGNGGTAKTAEAIANYLGMKTEALFEIKQDCSPLSSRTIRLYHTTISTILHEAEREMLITFNPCQKVSPPKTTEQTEREIFEPEEIASILEALKCEPLFWQALVNLLISTGARRGEIGALKWNSVNWETRTIKIDGTIIYSKEQGLIENKTKTGKSRYISLPQATIKVLRDFEASTKLARGNEYKETDYIFSTENGTPIYPSAITGWLEHFSKKHNLPKCHPHKFRHSLASILIYNNVDVVSVSRRLGHSKISTTLDTYSHIIQESEQRATDCIAEVMFNSPIRKQA